MSFQDSSNHHGQHGGRRVPAVPHTGRPTPCPSPCPSPCPASPRCLTACRELPRQLRCLVSQDKSESHRQHPSPAEWRHLQRRLRICGGVAPAAALADRRGWSVMPQRPGAGGRGARTRMAASLHTAGPGQLACQRHSPVSTRAAIGLGPDWRVGEGRLMSRVGPGRRGGHTANRADTGHGPTRCRWDGTVKRVIGTMAYFRSRLESIRGIRPS